MCLTHEIVPQYNSSIEDGVEPVHKLWELDSIGINVNEESPDDSFTQEQYLRDVKFESGQYWVRLPWRLNHPELPTNYRMAYGQLKAQLRELSKTPELLTAYNDIIAEQLINKFIEEVPPEQAKIYGHYLPHHGVKKNSKTTPLRIVFNCSARSNKNVPSLNDCLMTGPSLTEKLGDILLNFRVKHYAFTADISKAFLRVGLQEADRDCT